MTLDQFGNVILKWVLAGMRKNIQALPHMKTLTFTKTNCATAQKFLDGSSGANDEMPSGALFTDTPVCYFGGVRIVVKGATAWTGGSGTKFVCTDANGLELWEVPFTALTGNAVLETAADGIVYKGSPEWTAAGGQFVAPISIAADDTPSAGSDVVFTQALGIIGHTN
jgi:hypothetical protein